MSNRISSTLWVCVDCYVTEAYGAPSDDPDYKPDREPLGLVDEAFELSSGMSREEHDEDCPNREEWLGEDCGCERQEFSWSSCDGCGSTLGGSRYALTVWTPMIGGRA